MNVMVNVLTSIECRKKGLEQVTNLLITMSDWPDPTRQTSLKVLISAAQEVIVIIEIEVEIIEALLFELKNANARAKSGEFNG